MYMNAQTEWLNHLKVCCGTDDDDDGVDDDDDDDNVCM